MNAETESEAFSFEVVRSGRDIDLMYRAGARALAIHLERVVSPDVDFGAVTQNFECWDTPASEAMSPRDAEVAQLRLREWARERGLTIGVSRGLSREESLTQLERDGWTRAPRPDGSDLLTPPSPRTLLGRLFRRIFG